MSTGLTWIVTPSHRRDLFLLVAVTVVVLEFFSGKAFTIDDPLFLWLGAHLQTNPFDFFGFSVNWYGVEQPMYEVTRNPPLGGYYLALAAQLFGWGEVALHRAFLLPAALAAGVSYSLARRFCSRPLEAAFIGLATPAFLVSSTNVMCDTLMFALFCGSLRCWIEGLDRDRWTWLLAASILACFAFLAKYFALSLVPLFLAYGWARKRRAGAWTAFALAPIAALAAYEMQTAALYGTGLLFDAVRFATMEATEATTRMDVRLGVGLAFAGGCLAPVLIYAPLLWSWRFLVVCLALMSGLLVLIQAELFSKTGVPVPAFTYAQAAVMGVGGFSLVALAATEVWRKRDPETLLLGLWVLGTLVFAFFFNWVNNGRSNLPIAPAVGILIVRRIDWLRSQERAPPPTARWTALATSVALALAVTYSDYRWADEVRKAATGITREFVKEGRIVYFLGHWGFQYYMEAGGARAMRGGQDWVEEGELLVIPTNNTKADIPPKEHAEPIARTIHHEPAWLRTNSIQMSAGFYSSGYGSLPFVFGKAPPDAYYILVSNGRLGIDPE